MKTWFKKVSDYSKNNFLPPQAEYCFQQKLFWEDGRKSIHDFSGGGRQMQLKKKILSLQLVKYWGKRFPNSKKKSSEEFLHFLWPEATANYTELSIQGTLKRQRGWVRRQEAGSGVHHMPLGHRALLGIYWVNPHINLQIRGVDYTHFSAKDTKDL